MIVLIFLGGWGGIVGCGDRATVDSEFEVADDAIVEVEVDATIEVEAETAEDGEVEPADTAAEVLERDADMDLDASAGCQPCARGRIVRDERRVDDTRTRLLPVEVVPVAGFAVSVRAGEVEVASGRTDADGGFELPLEGLAEGPLELVFAAVAQGPDAPRPWLAVLDSAGVPVPRDEGNVVVAQRAWAWVVGPVAVDPSGAADFGEVHVTEAEGAGAIAIFERVTRLSERAIATFAADRGPAPEAPPTLAVLWNPSLNVTCIACYLPTGWGPINWHTSAGDVPFDRALFLSGADSAPLHFIPSLVAHELGHWVMDSFSRFPEAFGSHGWGQLSPPPLAWSEGFATFFAQWSLSSPERVEPRFFGKQSNVEFWVDLEAVGAGSAAAATSLSVVFQKPTMGGGLTQTLNEAVVAALLWDLWDAGGALEDEDVALGDGVVTGIADVGVGDVDRGVEGPDLVDMLDALACRVMTPTAWSAALMGFPWEAAAACP